jgi:hypothetical protein
MQLIRRNDEIALLLEKIRIQESALSAGEQQYNERLSDIQILKTKIRDINRDYNLTRNSHSKISELRRTVFNLEKDLLQVGWRCCCGAVMIIIIIILIFYYRYFILIIIDIYYC